MTQSANSEFFYIPSHVSNVVNVNSVLYKVVGDGACGANAHIYNDESYGHNLRRNMNASIVQHWFFSQSKRSFSYGRKVGTNEKEVSFERPEELRDYLQNSPESELLWMDSEFFYVLCKMYQLKKKVITYLTTDDDNPTVNCIGPDGTMSEFALVPNI